MNVLVYDTETTGTDINTARITELAYILWDTELKTFLVTGSFLVSNIQEEILTTDVVAMMKRVCGLTPEMLNKYGRPIQYPLIELENILTTHKVEYAIAHNGRGFDVPILTKEFERNHVANTTWSTLIHLDSRYDLPFAEEPDSKKLKHIALDLGVVNPFAHRALFDCATLCGVISKFDIKDIITLAATPRIVVRAAVSYDDRQLAKDARFSWEKIGDKTYPKMWVKEILETKLPEELARPFQVVRLT